MIAFQTELLLVGWLVGLFSMDLTTTVIGFAMSATFIIFVCTRFVCGRIRHEEPEPMLQVLPRIDIGQIEPESNCPVETVLIASIPTVKFENEAFQSRDDAQCSICLGDYQEKEILRIMPQCGHDFHQSCIDMWVRRHPTCPVCRSPLQDLFGKNMRMLSSS